MTIYIGSARKDERSKYSGGTAGDQLQKSTPDYSGEVSMQKFYVHTKGWDVLRLKDKTLRRNLAEKMIKACNNANIGYDQGNRGGILSRGTGTTEKTECDCSSLVRQCVKEATGKDPGNFTTGDEKDALLDSGLFSYVGAYTSSTTLCTGDVLVTRSKGHTVIVTASEGEDMDIDELPLIKYGSKGATVAALQGALKFKGYKLSVDGDFGSNTTKKVKAFQESRGLASDGQVGAKTWKALIG